MKLSFATLGCPGWTLDQIAERARPLGYDGVELRGVAGEHIGPDETPAARARIRELFARHGVALACIMGYTRFTVTDPKAQADCRAAMEKFLDVARDIGCPTIRVFGGKLEGTDLDANVRRVVEALKPLAAKAERCGVRLALETHDDWCVGANARAVLDGVGSPAVGMCWDVANSFFVEPLPTTFAAIRGRIHHVHFKDAAREDGKVHSKLPGTGEVDLRQALTLLHAGAYDGYLSFDWEKKWEPALAEPEVAFPHYVRFVTGLLKELARR
jgi:sugar phosphate isomerase/epimerase